MSREDPVAHERRVMRRLDARGEPGLGAALVKLDGSLVGDRYRLESLYAVGSEGAVFLARDVVDETAPLCVAKVALLPLHRPFDLTDEEIARRRAFLREEGTNLARAGSPYMPKSLGLFEFENPCLEADWGGEFAEPEPCIVMERLPGFDLDLWLARMHSSRVPKSPLRRQLDHVAVVVLTALFDMQERGFFYTDLRPGNIRIRGRSRERVRLMDAGSMVRTDDRTGKFPHVPGYLPPHLFEASRRGDPLLASPSIQAVMAGRTLFEVATGRVPLPGEPVETSALYGLTVSPTVAETIERLCRGAFPDVGSALTYLSENFRPPTDDRQKRSPTAKLRPPAAPARAEVPPAITSAARVASRPGHQGAVRTFPAPTPSAQPLVPPGSRPKLDLHAALAQARGGPAVPVPSPRVPEPVPEVASEPKPEVAPEPKPEVASEAKPEVAPETKPEVASEVKPDVAPEPKPEVVSEVKPEVAPEPRPEVVSEVKPDVAPEPKPEVVSEPKPEVAPEAVAEEAVAVEPAAVEKAPSKRESRKRAAAKRQAAKAEPAPAPAPAAPVVPQAPSLPRSRVAAAALDDIFGSGEPEPAVARAAPRVAAAPEPVPVAAEAPALAQVGAGQAHAGASAPATARTAPAPYVQSPAPTAVPLAQAFAVAPKLPRPGPGAQRPNPRTVSQTNLEALSAARTIDETPTVADDPDLLRPSEDDSITVPMEGCETDGAEGEPVLPPSRPKGLLRRFIDWLLRR